MPFSQWDSFPPTPTLFVSSTDCLDICIFNRLNLNWQFKSKFYLNMSE